MSMDELSGHGPQLPDIKTDSETQERREKLPAGNDGVVIDIDAELKRLKLVAQEARKAQTDAIKKVGDAVTEHLIDLQFHGEYITDRAFVENVLLDVKMLAEKLEELKQSIERDEGKLETENIY